MKLIKVGISGGIGSGKSTCSRIFESMGVPVYYADDRAKLLMWRSPQLKIQIKKVLGNEAYYRNGRLNRKFIASKIFSDDVLLSKINALVHPAVKQDAQEWFGAIEDKPYALEESALLVEDGTYRVLDKLIVVVAPKELRIQRVMSRDAVTREQVLARMEKQMPEIEKKEYADYVINNDGTQSLIKQIVKIHNLLTNLSLAEA